MNISKKRTPVNTPNSLIGDNFKPSFGVFNQPFKAFNFQNYKSNQLFRRMFNKLRLTEWEAVEVSNGKAAFLTVVYRFGLMNISKSVLYMLEEDKLYEWSEMVYVVNRSKVAKNLLSGNQSIYESKKMKTVIINNYQKDTAKCIGKAINKDKDNIEFDFELKNISKPSIVCIPIKEIYPVYTQKDLFKFSGSIKLNGQDVFESEDTLAIIDDHRGFYPRKSGYDWTTCFGYLEEKPFGLNLTDFRMNEKQEDYNENGYWNLSGFNLLPNASFTLDDDKKTITSKENDVNLSFKTLKTHKVSMNLCLFKIDYKLNFGLLNGYITDARGNKIYLKDKLSLAEYRYTVI